MSVNIGAVLMIFVYAINFYLLFQGFDFKSSFRSEGKGFFVLITSFLNQFHELIQLGNFNNCVIFLISETLIDSYNGSIQENGKRIMFQGLSLRS